MPGPPTRCGFCGRQTVTRAGRCPECGHAKQPPVTMPARRPPSVWRRIGSQLVAAAITLLLVLTAILVGSQVLLFVGLLVLAAIVVVVVVANGIP